MTWTRRFFKMYVYNSKENSTIYQQEVSIHYWNTKSSSIQYTKNIRADRNDTLVPTHDVNICIILTEHFISEYKFSNLIPLFNL